LNIIPANIASFSVSIDNHSKDLKNKCYSKIIYTFHNGKIIKALFIEWRTNLVLFVVLGFFWYNQYFVTSIFTGFCPNRSEFRVVRPLDIEIPRSLGTVVTSWNLPMHIFLKNCKCNHLHRPSWWCIHSQTSLTEHGYIHSQTSLTEHG